MAGARDKDAGIASIGRWRVRGRNGGWQHGKQDMACRQRQKRQWRLIEMGGISQRWHQCGANGMEEGGSGMANIGWQSIVSINARLRTRKRIAHAPLRRISFCARVFCSSILGCVCLDTGGLA